MTVHVPPPAYRMTVDQFHAWTASRVAHLLDDEPKWELFDGVPEMQEHKKWTHTDVKLRATLALRNAVERSALPLEVAIDGLGVRTGNASSYRPEAVVFPRGLIAPDDRYAPEPLIVVEVLSPSSRSKDLNTKLSGYSTVPTIMHYLVLDPEASQVLHHRRDGAGLVLASAQHSTGLLHLEPPGLELEIRALFA